MEVRVRRKGHGGGGYEVRVKEEVRPGLRL